MAMWESSKQTKNAAHAVPIGDRAVACARGLCKAGGSALMGSQTLTGWPAEVGLAVPFGLTSDVRSNVDLDENLM